MKITLDHMYMVTGLLLMVFALRSLTDRSNGKRVGTALFWALYAVTFLFGKAIPSGIIGAMVVVMALIASCKGLGLGSYWRPPRRRRDDRRTGSATAFFCPPW